MNPYFGLNNRYWLLLLATLFLGACGGGNSSPMTQTYTVNITVAGLTGTQLVLQNSSADDLVVTANGISLSADGRTLAVGGWGENSGATGIGGNQSNSSGTGAVYLY